jgi:CRP-like cAMP-binding protein
MSQGDRFTRLGKLLMTQLFLYNEERERDLLIPDAEMRIKYFLTSKPELARRLQQTYIASYLNVKPETFSRLKK